MPPGETTGHPWNPGGVMWHRFEAAGHAVEVLVRAGQNEQPGSWSSGWTVQELEPLVLCGQPAALRLASREEEHIPCVIDPVNGNHPATLPATTEVEAYVASMEATAKVTLPTPLHVAQPKLAVELLSTLTCDTSAAPDE